MQSTMTHAWDSFRSIRGEDEKPATEPVTVKKKIRELLEELLTDDAWRFDSMNIENDIVSVPLHPYHDELHDTGFRTITIKGHYLP